VRVCVFVSDNIVLVVFVFVFVIILCVSWCVWVCASDNILFVVWVCVFLKTFYFVTDFVFVCVCDRAYVCMLVRQRLRF